MTIELGSNLLTAVGGLGGEGEPQEQDRGGDGGVGRIRVEYCESPPTFSTSPTASTQKLNCYIADQAADPTHGLLNLPEFGSSTYRVQYGRRYVFPGSGNQSQSIRMPRQLYATATMDALVSNTGVSSGDLNLSLDIGADGTNDWTHNQTTSFPAALSITDIADALNAYIIDQTSVAWGADIDVPVKLTINRQADVILTNLVLTLQSNQPDAMMAAAMDLGADRPLDVPVVISGDHIQGEAYDFTHTLGPDENTLHPCQVYDQSGSSVKGVGKHCTDFANGTMPYSVFGDGQDGDLMINSGQTFTIDAPRTNVTASGFSVAPTNSTGFAAGDMVLFHQTQGTTTPGIWEFSQIAAIDSPTAWTLARPLAYNYDSTNGKAQAIKVPTYQNVKIVNGGTLTAAAWNGSTGGVLAFAASGNTLVQGTIDMSGKGLPPTAAGCLGCGPQPGIDGSGSSGGSGQGSGGGRPGGGGGGGGNAASGAPGGNGTSPDTDGIGVGGAGGPSIGSSDPMIAGIGGGGGQGGASFDQCQGNRWSLGGNGGQGGGAILISARVVDTAAGLLVSKGVSGASSGSDTAAGGGGGGAGGSTFITGNTISLGTNRISVTGGSSGIGYTTCRFGDGKPTLNGGDGGAGSTGRVRVQYCESVSGSSAPPVTSMQISCYTAEQIEQSPYTTTQLYLPDSFTDGQTYLVQYGRRFVFTGATSQASYLRVSRRMYGTASLDVLVSNTGVASGSLDLCLDIGNDGDCDNHPTGSWTFPLTLAAIGLADTFNDYLVTRSDVPWGDPVDVPVRVQIDRKADVMLTNLALTPVGAKTRFLRLPAQAYGGLTLGILFGSETTTDGALSYTVDIGADGGVDWADSATADFPAVVTTQNLAAAFNEYLAGRTGEVDVPIRITPSPSVETALAAFAATPTSRPDITVSTGDIAFSAADPVEGDALAVTATLHNAGGLDSGALTASFYATAPDWGEWYIGSAFVPNVPAGGATQAEIAWNTLGFTGDVPIRVSIDPYNRLAEPDETNNEATANLTIKTRPDLRVTEIALSDDEPVAGEAVEVTVTVHNYGQTAPAGSVLALYHGNPEAQGTELTTGLLSPAPGADATLTYIWTPDGPGVHRLFARTDQTGSVSEYDEGNNDTWRDVHIGFASPLRVDSGGGNAYDPAYSAALGFGYLNGDASTFCGTSSNGSQRSDWSGKVQYRFDHLLPGHFYHLDLTLYECDGLGRQEQVRIDDNLISDPIDLSDFAPHRLSFRLDPALYADRSIVVSIEELIGNNAVVSEINLYDIDYRYADAGGSTELAYTAALGYGWLDGNAQSTWGTLPHQTRRIEGSDNELRYRFDSLRSDKYYQLLITVYQGAGTTTVQQTIAVDSVDTGVTLEVTGIDRDDKVIDVPTGMYTGDGSITVRITRLGALAGAFINEIALEELTLLPEQVTQVTRSMDVHTGGPNWFSFNVKPPVRPAVACTGVTATSAFTSLYGSVLLGDAAAPAGTIVEAYTPGGVKTGCFKVAAEGLYGYMRVYGAEGATPGMQPGDPIILKVNGVTASPTPYPVVWQDDKGTRAIDLAAPDVIPVETLLASITDEVTKLQCENGTYLPPPADPRFNTCTTVAPGQGYLLWTNAATALSITGTRVVADQPVELHAGYNWLGYLPTCELAVTTALAGIDGKYDILHSEAGTYKPPPANPAYNNFNTMAPGRGYMIHMTQAATLTYPADLCGAAQNVAETTFTCPAAATSRFTHFYGHVTPVEDATPGAVILAYSPRGEVVGCGEVREDGLYPYLRVYGAEDAQPGMQEGEPVRFTVNGRVTLKSTEAIWQNDWDVHPLDLTVGGIQFHLPMIWR